MSWLGGAWTGIEAFWGAFGQTSRSETASQRTVALVGAGRIPSRWVVRVPLRNLINPRKALIFRIVHRDNVAWHLANGLHCSSSATKNPAYVGIGNQDLISKRETREIPVPPGGTLGDFIPFYFTPCSPMLLNILTGRGGVQKRAKDEIVILVSSLPKLTEYRVRYLFTNCHAYLDMADFSADPQDLAEWIPWRKLHSRDFRRDPYDPVPFERYQAEALAHRQVPIDALIGLACYDESVKSDLEALCGARKLELSVRVREDWYFA